MARRQQQSKSNRMGRVNEQIKKVVSQAINYELTNKKVTGMITVTRVNTTPDLRYSRIYISLFNCKNNAEIVESRHPLLYPYGLRENLMCLHTPSFWSFHFFSFHSDCYTGFCNNIHGHRNIEFNLFYKICIKIDKIWMKLRQNILCCKHI
jgi:hypothetical protein